MKIFNNGRARRSARAAWVALAAFVCACSTGVVSTSFESSANAASSPAPNSATVYEVGPNQHFKTPNDVPWDKLKPGDTVLIHWRPEAYHNKWVICAEGTEHAPITVRGVPSANGLLPMIDGDAATTSKHTDYWGENRSIIKIGGARMPKGVGSKWIVIENLDVSDGRPAYSYTSGKGKVEKYQRMAAAIWVENCEHLIVRSCSLHNCGNGFFVSSNDERASEDVLVENCHIYDNGDGSGYEHNVYSEAKGIVYQYNWFGHPRKGAIANNLKDRSSGCVIRYNWFDAGDKLLDLVDAEDSKIIRDDPSYRQTFVYGNIMIKYGGAGHPQVVHYGGDSGKEARYRKGTLYFYNNTVVSIRRDAAELFWLSSNDEICDARNNIFYAEGPAKSLALVRNGLGILLMSHNFLRPGFRKVGEGQNAIVRDDKTSVLAESPDFIDVASQNYHLNLHSPCVGRAMELAPAALPITSEYRKHQGSSPVPPGTPLSIGAFQP